MKIAVLGLTITSSWGNGHATTYRSLLKALHARGHQIAFIEKDVEWYRSHRDLTEAAYCEILLYEDWRIDGNVLALRHARDADVVVIGSYFPDGIVATESLLNACSTPMLFYDIDTPVTLAQLRASGCAEYLDAKLIPYYAAYMSFTGGPVLEEIESRFGSPFAAPLYCSVDPAVHRRTPSRKMFRCDLSYLGTYARDRQPKLEALLQEPARALPKKQFLVAGPLYPETVKWAPNVKRTSHVPPADHPALYSSSRFTLNITRDDMVDAGYSPSVRLFEASACAAAIISDCWPGIEAFLEPGEEILLPRTAEDIVDILTSLSDAEARTMGDRARARILSAHTANHRAREFEEIVDRAGTRREVRQEIAPRQPAAAAV
jgi:spore maturation protein CgeB